MRSGVMDRIVFGLRVREARLDKGLSQRGLASTLGKDDSTVAHWETGKNLPDLETFVALCLVLGIRADALLGIA
jgi:XRE family transcriptional regulator, fatty acid utilization regulator